MGSQAFKAGCGAPNSPAQFC